MCVTFPAASIALHNLSAVKAPVATTTHMQQTTCTLLLGHVSYAHTYAIYSNIVTFVMKILLS